MKPRTKIILKYLDGMEADFIEDELKEKEIDFETFREIADYNSFCIEITPADSNEFIEARKITAQL